MRQAERRELAIVGARGFIGSAALRASASAQDWAARPVVRGATQPYFSADIRDAASITAALDGCAAVLHSASYVGNDVSLCATVNVDGTRNVARAANSIGARLVYVSTSAVYGRGPIANLDEKSALVRPASTLSASRADAERIVLDHGGVVVRPHLVLGAGDRWVGRGLAQLTRTLGGLVDDGEAMHSVIEVNDLGRVLVSLAISNSTPQSVYHAANLSPISTQELTQALWPSTKHDSVPSEKARAKLSGTPQLVGALDVIGTQHVLNSSAARRDTSVPLAQPFALPAVALVWYREADGGALRSTAESH